MSSYSLTTEKEHNYIVHPQKFGLWLFILTVIMIFGGFTSAYIVQRGAVPADLAIYYELPAFMWYNLVVVLVSSITMQYAVWSNQRGQKSQSLLGLGMTLILGGVFLYGQWEAFSALTESGLPFVDQRRNDNSVSFFYVIAGVHGLHIVAAILAVLATFWQSAVNSFQLRRRRVVFEMTATFWHFLGLLWVYLFLFLKYA
jgi:cytochrome c oxidase subunit III